jgi:hypothetical protein
VALLPAVTAPGYSSVRNLISELAAQNTPYSGVMATAFVLLGASIAAAGLRPLSRGLLPFVAFGLCFAAAGLFGHKPIGEGIEYRAALHAAHSALGTLSGIALTVGFVVQALRPTGPRRRAIAWALASVCVAFPLLMLALPAYQGAIQRLMYAVVFAWLWTDYPDRARLRPAPRAGGSGKPKDVA